MGWIGLRDYQREAVDKMKTGCILCGGVGSGKSRTAIAYYYAKNEGDLEAETYVPMGDPPKDLYIVTTARKRFIHSSHEVRIRALSGSVRVPTGSVHRQRARLARCGLDSRRPSLFGGAAWRGNARRGPFPRRSPPHRGFHRRFPRPFLP